MIDKNDYKLEPLGARILVQRAPAKNKTECGIIIPYAEDESSQEGVVDAVGEDVRRVAAGDYVLLPKFGGTDVRMGGVDYTLIEECDILGRLVPAL